MGKKRFALLAHVKPVAKNVRRISDHEIDFSDIPDSTDEELKQARRVGRPKTGRAKLLIAFRIDPQLLAQIRQLANKQHKPYQTLIHELLAHATKRKAA